MVVGLAVALWTMVILPVLAPGAVGLNLTISVQFCPAARLPVLHVPAGSTMKSVLAEIEEIMSAPEPLFVSVTMPLGMLVAKAGVAPMVVSG